MAILSDEQREFLLANKIPLGTVFDATGLSKQRYSELMKEIGCLIAIGVTPCRKGGHTMRTRAGHCLQCDSSKWAYQSRHSKDGQVYVAVSLEGGFIKIGTAVSAIARIESLNTLGYASVEDWQLIAIFDVESAGEIEFLAQRSIEPYAFGTSYEREGRKVSCLETFRW